MGEKRDEVDSIADRKRLVLIADAHPQILRMMKMVVRKAGYDVLTAQDGEEALSLVESNAPDILLLDLMLPVIDGFQVLRRLRTFSQIPAIALSIDWELRSTALKSGANAFIAKPFDPDVLLSEIKTLLSDS